MSYSSPQGMNACQSGLQTLTGSGSMPKLDVPLHLQQERMQQNPASQDGVGLALLPRMRVELPAAL